MAFHVFLFLLVTFLLFCLLQLWPFCWSHHGSAQSRTVAKMRSTLHRLLKPRTPLDCPACRLASTPSSVVGPPPAPVRPWREVKRRRGAPKRVKTEGYACPNPQCPYFGITDAHVHALLRRWQAWPSRADPDVPLSGLPHHLQCSAQHTPVSPENSFPSCRHGTLCTRRRTGCFRGRAGLRLSTSDHHDLAVACWRARSDLARTLLLPSLASTPPTG